MAGILAGLLVLIVVVYFPGRQTPLAITLATGLGVEGLQARVDGLEEKAIRGGIFTETDRAFLRDLYTCFAKGARLTFVLRQSAQLMAHYLSRSGEGLRLAPRIFSGSGRVRARMAALKQAIILNVQERGAVREEYVSPEFYMGDPEFFESFVGLYYGRLKVRPRLLDPGRVRLQWRVDMPWQWPSYSSLQDKYGDAHAQCFSLPNLRSFLQGPRFCLRMDDGLGGHLVQLGLAKPFLVRSEWEETMDVPIWTGAL